MGGIADQSPVSTSGVVGACALASFALASVQECAVVIAGGEIDLYTSPALHNALANAAEGSDRIIIDLSLVEFLDSTGMAVMVQALNQTHHRQRGTVCLAGPAGMVLRALEITGLTTMFPIYPSVEQAAHALAATRGVTG